MSKRTHNIMLRLTTPEHAAIEAVLPPGEELAVFARCRLLDSVTKAVRGGELRLLAGFVVAALSEEIGFDEAVSFYDTHVADSQMEAAS